MTGQDPRADALRWLALWRDLGVGEIAPRRRAAPPAPAAAHEGPAPVETPAGPVPAIEAGAMADVDPAEALRRLREDVIGDCTRCRLCEGRTKLVFGVGNPRARLMFVGEGPGADEDRQGEPFVGRAGQLLDKIIAAMGLSRQEVYIGNVVKCRPPENRTPLPDESATCLPFLEAQIRIIRPAVIVALGKTAAVGLTGVPIDSITRERGRWLEVHGVPVKVTFHPAYLLRSPAAKRPVWEDMQDVMARLGLFPRP